ncbi:MAG TPA: tetratricopeptide repeat protein [Pyrinomonadaceae bacterium]|nr:tetratricopeptide repeat protein [Pyrinomonadaceae bacterium]
MKQCPQCNRIEADDALAFCRADGTALISDSSPPGGEAGTKQLGSASTASEIETSILPNSLDSGIARATVPTSVLTQTTPHTTQELTKAKRRKALTIGAAVLAAIIIVIAAYFFLGRREGAVESVAVLPFENKSGNADSEYLSDGLSESLIYRLSQLPNLKVSPTSSVIRYKGKEADVAQIAKELEVDAVMSGRLAQRGDNLTISVELIDARTRKLLWGEQYERKMSELLVTQREIAAEITNKLQLKLSGEGKQKLAKKYTDNNEAYQVYLKARYHFSRRAKQDLQKSIEFFQQAIKLDPKFALAYAGIAELYATMPLYPYLSPKEAVPQAKAAVAKALELDPELAEAHTIAGYIASGYDWNWAEAEREFKRAIELEPNLANAHYRYAWTYLTPLGRHEAAIAEMKRAMELEPLNLIQGAHFAAVYMYARQLDGALEQARKTSDLDPAFVIGKSWLCFALNAKGMYAESLAVSEKTLQTDFLLLPQVSYAYAKMGRRQQAKEIINRWKEIERSEYVLNYWIAVVYAALGEKDAAFAELEKAYQARDFFFHRLKVDPFMDPLRDDPRYKEMLKRLNLPE